METNSTTSAAKEDPWAPVKKTARLVFDDGLVLSGAGIGATGIVEGEVCFNTAMTGYQEILTDPSYAGQFITFTFPHIGNVGVNADDQEQLSSEENFEGARGIILREGIPTHSNWRAKGGLNDWLRARKIVGITGIDTRALTARIREAGMPNAVLAHDQNAQFDIDALKAMAARWPGLVGRDLVPDVTSEAASNWQQTSWQMPAGFGTSSSEQFHVVAIDFGVKRNILRLLAERGCRLTVVPAQTPATDILSMRPDGIFLSNGPGDPAATGTYAVETIRTLAETKIPMFGICLGHQMLALAFGGTTKKMHQGHHGANHPVVDHETGKVEVTSMNHGFAVDSESLPPTVKATHTSLFDGSNCGLRHLELPAFSVQHHPEASPGPRDSHYLFDGFIDLMAKHKAVRAEAPLP
ncbi:MAG: glutamine-hydrolyzing carbamoyl-phosphate synthase small subunit [Pseudomonadota bacterium]